MARAHTSATIWWTRAARRWSGHRVPARRGAKRCTACVLRHPNCVLFGGITAHVGALAAVLWLAGPGAHRDWLVMLPIALLALIPANEIAVERGEPAGDRIPAAAHAAQARPLARGRHPAGVPHRGGDPDAVRQRGRGEGGAGAPGGAVPGQSRGAPALRVAQRLHRRGHRDAAGRRGHRARRRRGRARAQRAICRRTRRRVLPVPPAAPVERARGRLDGMGAQAWQARRVQPVPARRCGGRVQHDRRRRGDHPPGSLRHHAGCRYRAAAGRRAARWSGPSRTRSTARCTTPSAAAWCEGTASCSRAWACRCRVRTARASPTIHSGHPGVDPYTTAVSDVYQDLYGEGSFTGKGIYDVDAFEQATHGRFPENTLLSHDLIEGSYARAGLATDIEVFDDYPTHYLTCVRRKHRWIRGDWQLLRWLSAHACPARTARSATGCRCFRAGRSSTTCDAAWSRSRSCCLLVAGWTVLPGSPLRWTVLGLAADRRAVDRRRSCSPPLRPPLDKSWRAYYAGVGTGRGDQRRAGGAGGGVPAAPGVDLVRTPSCARSGARSSPAATCSSGRPRRRRSGPRRVAPAWYGAGCGRRWRSAPPSCWWRRCAGPAPRHRTGGRSPSPCCPSRCCGSCRRPIAHALGAPPVRRERRLPPHRRDQALRYARLHWAFFERFVTADDELARARQLPGRPGAGDGDAHVADEHRPAAAWPP